MKMLVSVMVSALVAWGGLAFDTRGGTIKIFRPVNTNLNVVAPLGAAQLINRGAGIAKAQRSVQTRATDRSNLVTDHSITDHSNRNGETVYRL